MLTIVDDFSRSIWTNFMQNKGQLTGLLTKFLNYVQNHFSAIVKNVKTDNGLEFS